MNIRINLLRSNVIWFHLNDAASAIIFSKKATPGEGLVSCGYDYEMVDGMHRFHLDIGIQTIEADSLFRVSFEFKYFSENWDNVFNPDFIKVMVDAAIQKSQQGFGEQFVSHQLKPPVITFKDNTHDTLVSGMIEGYFNYRRQDDINNSYLINTPGITITRGRETSTLLKGTLIILDTFLFGNTSFDNKHNREVFGDMIPFTKYLTLKMTCMDIDSKDLHLSFLNLIYLLQSIDCAIKLLLGNKADMLIPILEQSGLNENVRKIFIKGGTKLFKTQQESFKKSGARVMNLEEDHDWDALFR